MQTLRIYLLGTVELFLGSDRLSGFATQKSRALFAYLVLGKGKQFSRDQLADVFWPDLPEARARRALSTDLWRIGTLLKDGGADPDRYLVSDAETVRFNAQAPHWVDVDRFDTATGGIDRADPAKADRLLIDEISEAVSLYRGDLLESNYDDWCQARRDVLQAQHLRSLEFLMDCYLARCYWANALAVAQKILRIDPFLEHIQRAVMRCHFNLGNRPAAVKQYANCAKLLRQELDVAPMEETRQVLETIVAAQSEDGFGAVNGIAPPNAGFPSVEMRLQEINLAIASIDAARNCLINAERQLREQSVVTVEG